MHCHCGTNNRAPRWTSTDPCKPEVRPGAGEESVSPAWLAAPSMYVRDTTKVYIWRLDTWCRPTRGRKNSMSSSEFLIFGLIEKTGMSPWPLIKWDIFDIFSERTDRNSPKLDRTQELYVFFKFCGFFSADRNYKMSVPASDLPKHFRLLLWNRWTEFAETWREAAIQCLIPSLCFSGR